MKVYASEMTGCRSMHSLEIQFAWGSSESGSFFIQTWDASQNTALSCSELSSNASFGENPVAANFLNSEKLQSQLEKCLQKTIQFILLFWTFFIKT